MTTLQAIALAFIASINMISAFRAQDRFSDARLDKDRLRCAYNAVVWLLCIAGYFGSMFPAVDLAWGY